MTAMAARRAREREKDPGPEDVAILPLRASVLFPMSVVPVSVGRARSVRLITEIAERDALIGVLTQRDAEIAEPDFSEMAAVGTLARVVKVVQLGPRSYSVILNGICRFEVLSALQEEPYQRAAIRRIVDPEPESLALTELCERLRSETRAVLALLPEVPRDTVSVIENVRQPGALADLIVANLPDECATLAQRQGVLEAFDLTARVERVHALVSRQRRLLTVKQQVSEMVSNEFGKSQREYVLRQQLKVIREELGESGEDDELAELRERIDRAELPDEAAEAARKQLGRLGAMPAQSPEYSLARNYVEWLADLPWRRSTPDILDVKAVRACLDEDHWGLEEAKRRIVEYAAIRQLRSDKRGPILLFVGPPGVGKTSLGRSIARSMGRAYGRVALGGVRDEAEIRGHRRTYVGALPGRIIQAMKKAGSRNPVLVLDEVDKLGADQRGDPASALLEVLDPEQNNAFVDHYIGVSFDLSQVTFLATANTLHTIPDALRDRLEVIEVPGYTRRDKLEIARHFLIEKQIREHGLGPEQLAFSTEGLEAVLDRYTREAGVRGLERQLAAVCRDLAVRLAEGEAVPRWVVEPGDLARVLGIARHRPELAEREAAPGVATGLGVNAAGGELLLVEVTKMPGKGELRVTGNLRQIMRESAETAVSFVRSHAKELHLEPEQLMELDLHVHIPRAGLAEDAASAGVALYAAVCSLLLHARVRPDVAMLGELTLRGQVLPVQDVRAKLLAAHRAGVRTVLLPERNEADLQDVGDDILKELDCRFIRRIDQVLPLVLEDPSALSPRSDVAGALADGEP